jgi:hypothetical protein
VEFQPTTHTDLYDVYGRILDDRSPDVIANRMLCASRSRVGFWNLVCDSVSLDAVADRVDLRLAKVVLDETLLTRPSPS